MAAPALLLVNGNTTTAVTERLARHARALAPAGTEIAAVTAPFGARYIQSRVDVAIAAHAILVACAQAAEARSAGRGRKFDAAIIGCFGEPGMTAAREIFDFPVVGMAEAAMLTACQLGRRFAIVTAGQRWPEMLRELVAAYGLADRCAGVAALPASGLEVSRSGSRLVPGIARLIRSTVAATGADIVILGGAGFAGMASAVRRRVDVPVVDGLEAALGQALQLARLSLVRRGGATRHKRNAKARGEGMVGVNAALLRFAGSGKRNGPKN